MMRNDICKHGIFLLTGGLCVANEVQSKHWTRLWRIEIAALSHLCFTRLAGISAKIAAFVGGGAKVAAAAGAGTDFDYTFFKNKSGSDRGLRTLASITQSRFPVPAQSRPDSFIEQKPR
jgi:hypothetical protein